MKIIAIEEHFATAGIMAAWTALPAARQDVSISKSQGGALERRLYDLAEERLHFMAKSGVNLQVLSLGTPGVQSLDPEPAITLARSANDLLSEIVRKAPDRFQAFSVLPTPSPAEAARELERAISKLGLNGAMIYGRTGDKNLDHPDFIPIFEAAAALHAPITLHPQTPDNPVRNAYYSGFDDQFNNLIAGAGIGWHYETGIQVLRLILSCIFDRYPDLQLILGHWGEMILFFLDRIDLMSAPAKLQMHISEYFKNNISVTPSGVFSQRYLHWAIELLGSERIMLATDYPYQINENLEPRNFLESADLSKEDRNNIAYANWERITAAIKR